MPSLYSYGYNKFNRKESPQYNRANQPDLSAEISLADINQYIPNNSIEIDKLGVWSGQVSFDNGIGFWLGLDAGTPKFSLGNSAGNKITWNGSTMNISGTFTASNIHIPDVDTTANSFHVNSSGDAWWGCTETNFNLDNDNATAYVLKTGVAKFQSVTLETNVIVSGLQAGSDIHGQYLTALSVTAGSIANATITGGKIASATITASNITALTITAAEIANATITGTKIASATITGSNIASATITGSNISSATITATNITNATITATQINSSLLNEIEANLPPDENLVGYWSFNEGEGTVVYDSSQNSNNGATVNTPSWTPGVSGNAIALNGSSQYVGSITAPFGGANVTNASFTIWENFDDFSQSHYVIYQAFGDSLYPRIHVNHSTGNIALQYRLDGVTKTITVNNFTTTYNAGEPIMFGASFDNTTGAKLYINGVEVGENTDTGTDFDGGANYIQVGYGSNLGYYLKGSATEFRIYDITLTAKNMYALYKIPNGQSSPRTYGGNIQSATITATQIAAATITANEIANATITATQIANATITTTQISGTANITGGQIASATITGGNVASATLTGGNIAANTIAAGNIAALTITAAEIANLTITASQIANLTITGGAAGKIALATIARDNIVANTITAGEIAAGTITATQIATNTITANEIAANTITASQIAASTITATEMNVSTLSAIAADMGTITAGTITLGTSGYIRGGQTAYATGTGFFLGYEAGAYKFSIGNVTEYLRWTGTGMEYYGDVNGLPPFGGDGSDGALNVTSGTTTLNTNQIYNYSSINVSVGATLAFTGDDGPALLNCSGNCTIAGTIELRGLISTPFSIRTARNDSLSTGSAKQSITANSGGSGASGDGSAGDGGDGGTSTTAGAGTGGAGGAIGGGNGSNGAGGGSSVGGGGGGGGGGYNPGPGATAGSAGGNASGTTGGVGGTGGNGGGSGGTSYGGGGGGGGGGYNTGNGGAGGVGGGGNYSTSPSGTGGNSGANGGNGGVGGNGSNGYSGGQGGNGGSGYTTGGNGGTGGNGSWMQGGSGGSGGNSQLGTGGNGAGGGSGGSFGTSNGGNGGNGGSGRTGGDGGNGGAGGTGTGHGGAGGTGGAGKVGPTCLVLYVAGNLTYTGTVNAQGGDGGDGGNGGSGPGGSGAGGAGGAAGDGSDIYMICEGTLTNSGTTNNSAGTPGSGGTGSSTGATGAAGNDGETVIAALTLM